MKRYYTKLISKELWVSLHKTEIYNPLCQTYAGVLDTLLARGYFIYVTPSIKPDDYKPGIEVDKWDSLINGEQIAMAVPTFEEAMECAISVVISEIAEKATKTR